MVYFRSTIAVMLVFAAMKSIAAVSLQDVKFSELPGGGFEMRADFSAPPQDPQGYAIDSPARIILDMPGVESRLSQKKYPLSFDNAQSAVVLTASDRTRIIINLSSPAAYSTSVSGNTLVAVIDGAASGNASPRPQSQPQSQKQAVQNFSGASGSAITDIDFRRGEDGEGQLLLGLSNPAVSVDIEKSGSNITMSFVDTVVSDDLRRRLDVVDFATPVKFIETISSGKNTQISIDATGDFEYLAYQTDGTYVVSVKPLTPEQLEEKKARFAFVGEKLSLNFQDIEVRKVLEIIADFTDLNLVASDTVQGNITLRLENVPWDQALELVLKSKGLDKRQAGNVLLVAPAAEIAERERQELEARKQLQELAPLQTEFIRIRYASAKDVFELFGGGSSSGDSEDSGSQSTKSILSERGTAIVDERTNSIILTETADKIAEFKQLIAQVDIPIRQVMIEARIVAAEDDFTEALGIDFNASADTPVNGNQLDGAVRNGSSTGVAPTSPTLGNFGIGYVASNIALDLELSALETSGYSEIVAQPKVITGDKQQASIETGQQIPFESSDGEGGTTTIFQDALLKLDVTPQITPDNRVIMELKVNQDSPGDITPDGLAINVTELSTVVLVGDGQTIVLGGVFQESKNESESKVPLLGDIPILGRLFRNSTEITEKRELLIFITPRILSDNFIDK